MFRVPAALVSQYFTQHTTSIGLGFRMRRHSGAMRHQLPVNFTV